VGCYAVNAARLVAGHEPVSALGFAAMTPAAVDEAFTGVLRFPGDVVASIHSSFREAYRTWLEVGGTDGVIRVENPFRPGHREDIVVQRDDESRRVTVEGSPLLFVRQIEDFVAAALDGRPTTVSLSDSRGNAAALAALHESARSGRAVQI
jgi:predicted dehydrogenase